MELIRWGADVARVEGEVAGQEGRGPTVIEVAIARSSAGARKRIRVNGVGRRAAALSATLRSVLFAPEDMLLVAGSPSLRRAAIDGLATQRSPAYGADLATYGRALAQRNRLLRAIREEGADRSQLRFWDAPLIEAGAALVAERLRSIAELAEPLRATHAEIAPDEAAASRLSVEYRSNVEYTSASVRDALARRLEATADKEIWNGSTLVGPHRDDLLFRLGDRDLADFGSRGQQRTAILAFKLAELDLLAAHDGRQPLLLLDDVFSELDPDRRGHLVRRIADLPQAFVTTTTPDDLDPTLVAASTGWRVVADGGTGATLIPGDPSDGTPP